MDGGALTADYAAHALAKPPSGRPRGVTACPACPSWPKLLSCWDPPCQPCPSFPRATLARAVASLRASVRALAALVLSQ